MSKVGRNQPCPCGSGVKFKKCHGRFRDSSQFNEDRGLTPDLKRMLSAVAAKERIRELQQGFGRPIISWNFKGHQMVAIGSSLYYSKDWRTFPDFLASYIVRKMGAEWGAAENAKPLRRTPPAYAVVRRLSSVSAGRRQRAGRCLQAEITGIVACYLGVAYALYLLEHNAELQARTHQPP